MFDTFLEGKALHGFECDGWWREVVDGARSVHQAGSVCTQQVTKIFRRVVLQDVMHAGCENQ